MKTIITFFCIVSFLLQGCIPSIPTYKTKATVGELTANYQDLISMPKPKEKIYCAVYKFRDQTGQYKAVESGTSWSTAVTQGATTILIKALEESGWFIPIEREGLSNLLNERKIIRSSRENIKTEKGKELSELPPLLFAGILLEGGIISYETNVYTSGLGIKYFGAGGSGTYRQDQVTVYLRAISTQNGRILKTVHSTKTILSQALDINFYRYVELKRLLETEVGYTHNEPPQLCVTAAIEKAVQSLIVEGIFDGYWQLENAEDINSKIIQDYNDEKKGIKSIDIPKRVLGIGINFGGNNFNGDYGNSLIKPQFDGCVDYHLNNEFSINASAGLGTFEAEKFFKAQIYYANFGFNYYFYPESRFTPFLNFGGKLIYRFANEKYFNYKQNFPEKYFIGINSGLGLRYTILQNLDLNIIGGNSYFFDDELDNVINGRWNDYIWSIKTGFTFYFF